MVLAKESFYKINVDCKMHPSICNQIRNYFYVYGHEVESKRYLEVKFHETKKDKK
jgi:hypothetical protein